MKKKQIICLIAFIVLALIVPNNVNAKKNVVYKKESKDINLIYKVDNGKTELPFQQIKILNKAVDTTAISSVGIKSLTATITSLSGNNQNMNNWLDGYGQQQNCSGGLLGNVNDDRSVAWLLQKVLDYAKIIGPFIVLVMSGIDFAKVIVTSDDDGLKKAQKKLIIRLLLAASLFFLPELVSALLDLFGITSDATCGLS